RDDKYLLFKPLGHEDLPTLKELTTSEVRKVWAGTWRCIRRQLLQKRTGTFAVVPVHSMLGEGKILPVERLMFPSCKYLKKFYKLKCAKTKIPDKKRDETLTVQLDFKQIASSIHFRQEIVEQCTQKILLFFAEAL
ncbi:Coiled-coil domain-containing protein 81, partial [Apaloderma vittatum]